MKYLLLSLLCALQLHVQKLQAQELNTALISGNVTDAETGERLSDAYIRVGALATISNA
jgi:hypothetical protein